MATYTFETITPQEALAYDSILDNLVFATPGESGSRVSVQFLLPLVLGAPAVSMTSAMSGRNVLFGPGLYNEGGISFPDGSRLFVGTPLLDDNPAGVATAFADGFYGSSGNDTFVGGGGDDLLQGNQGGDNLNGGAGVDAVYGGQGDDLIFTGGGADTSGTNFAHGNIGNDTVSAEESLAMNTLLGGQGADSIVGGHSADFLNGNLGSDQLTGNGGDDRLFGEGSDDTLSGGTGADSLSGGTAADLLSGGVGADLFRFEAGASGVTAGATDRITDWAAEDSLDLSDNPTLGAGGATNYLESTAADFASALAQANGQIAGGTVDYVAVQVGGDVVVFADSQGDNGGADDAIVLVGRTLADIAASNIVAGA